MFVQQGGHGFAQGRIPSEVQKSMVKEMRELGVEVYCQPPNSPEFNLCDLALFWSLKSTMRSHSDELGVSTRDNKSFIQSVMWTTLRQVVEHFDARALFNASMQREMLLLQAIESNGDKVKEKHWKIRKQWGTRANEY